MALLITAPTLLTLIVLSLGNPGTCSIFNFDEIAANIITELPPNLTLALKDIAKGIPTDSLTVVRGNSTRLSNDDLYQLVSTMFKNDIQVVNMDLSEDSTKKDYFDYLAKALELSIPRTSFIICEPFECEDILSELTEKNYMQRNILYIFYWDYGDISSQFLATMTEAMRIAVITNPRENVYRVYYNQAVPSKLNHLSLVNWWSGKLYKSPTLPPAKEVYHDFQKRMFNVPVLHAPPWHFVQLHNDSNIEVTGGRDHKLLGVLAEKLNFRFQYYDPPDRSQGSGKSPNGTFKGTLGLLWKRKADFFVGDVTMTWERLQGVEFSFLTLADSGAFVTHSPSKLNEALALIRPFKWDVWPILVATLLIAGPALWLVIAIPNLWKPEEPRTSQAEVFSNCCWFTTTLFLRQSSGKEPSSSHKARLVAVLMSLGATYVLGDMYSANLTSLMAKPAREQPIGTLQALEEAMRNRGYELVVERHSSSLAILENGTGVYGRLAKLMRRQRVSRVRSVERGVRLVLSKRTVAVLGGRETLYYDTKRFGANNFHLSEKLYTRYSAIALQIGCPYIDNLNDVVMKLFEAGILTKMTTDEYEKLGEKRTESVAESEVNEVNVAATSSVLQTESTRGLEPVSLRMLRGAFILLGCGHFIAAIAFLGELEMKRRQSRKRYSTNNSRSYSKLRSWTIGIFGGHPYSECSQPPFEFVN